MNSSYTLIYRGQVFESSSKSIQTYLSTSKDKTKKLIYRGQIIERHPLKIKYSQQFHPVTLRYRVS